MRARLGFLLVVVGLLAPVVVNCGPRRVSSAPDRPYTTWRVVLQSRTGSTVQVVEMPRLWPFVQVTACQVAGRRIVEASATAERACFNTLDAPTAWYRFLSLELDSMTAIYRSTDPQ